MKEYREALKNPNEKTRSKELKSIDRRFAEYIILKKWRSIEITKGKAEATKTFESLSNTKDFAWKLEMIPTSNWSYIIKQINK